MKKWEWIKILFSIIIMLSILVFMIILTIVESIYYIIAVIATVVFVLLFIFDHDTERCIIWGQLVVTPFALCIAIIVRNILLSVWR